ncbi:hypothetical protein [Streptomyces tailanensis]|uniref:hypothetical protein n=1 Tax=Streptomyces tailanensis TaxID=2569858 RepID=UPI00122E7808|nr:hypothetical protein [Streptomyces tailanensis]
MSRRPDELCCARGRLTAEHTPRNVPARRLVAALGGGEVDDAEVTALVSPDRLRAFRSWLPYRTHRPDLDQDRDQDQEASSS